MGITIYPGFLDSPSLLLSTTQEQNYRFGLFRLKADQTVQEVGPRTVPVHHQKYNKKNQRNPHSIEGRADTPHIRNRVADAFPIQFPVLYYP